MAEDPHRCGAAETEEALSAVTPCSWEKKDLRKIINSLSSRQADAKGLSARVAGEAADPPLHRSRMTAIATSARARRLGIVAGFLSLDAALPGAGVAAVVT